MHMCSKTIEAALKDGITPAYRGVAHSPTVLLKIYRFNATIFQIPAVLAGFQTVLPIVIPRIHFRLAITILALLTSDGSHNKIPSLVCDFFAATTFDVHRIGVHGPLRDQRKFR